MRSLRNEIGAASPPRGAASLREAHHASSIRALIERAQAMPQQGRSSGFKYGRAVGAIEASIVLCSIPVEIIEPSAWKRHWHLPGKDKESSRQKALQLFPAAHAALARKRDHGRAEAALLAAYYAERQLRIAA